MRALLGSRLRYSLGTVTLIMSPSAPATSTPVGPPPTTTMFERAARYEARVTIDLFEQTEDARAQSGRVVERVQRERVLGGAGGAEEIRLRPSGQHQHVAGPRLPLLGRHGSARGVSPR